MQIIIGISIGIAISFGTIIVLRLIGWIKLRIIRKRNERYLNDQIFCTGSLGLPRYREDGSYIGPKSLLVTNYALEAEHEYSERMNCEIVKALKDEYLPIISGFMDDTEAQECNRLLCEMTDEICKSCEDYLKNSERPDK